MLDFELERLEAREAANEKEWGRQEARIEKEKRERARRIGERREN